ncbi:MAG: NADH-quinone oxidoreductase subunit J [Bacteroidota bacterium]|nr:NADH-quinone oxidoreductase subunit J [Bacteroidota bacterium]MDP4205355.1 NADH-quinone oxidoreductase subunit J [Bacteroidota bacterium]
MSAQAIAFYILGALAIVCSALTIFSRMIFRSAIYLLFSLISIAGIYFLMEMDFIAALQIMVYVGGIVVLIIFSIFLTHRSGDKLPCALTKRSLIGGIIALSGLALSGWIILRNTFTATNKPAVDLSIRNIGRQMLDYQQHGYVYPFEIISFLILAALIGCIVIAVKDKKE